MEREVYIAGKWEERGNYLTISFKVEEMSEEELRRKLGEGNDKEYNSND